MLVIAGPSGKSGRVVAACFASGRVSPEGDRVVTAATTLDETLGALLGGNSNPS
jgi:hypothetical protein